MCTISSLSLETILKSAPAKSSILTLTFLPRPESRPGALSGQRVDADGVGRCLNSVLGLPTGTQCLRFRTQVLALNIGKIYARAGSNPYTTNPLFDTYNPLIPTLTPRQSTASGRTMAWAWHGHGMLCRRYFLTICPTVTVQCT